MLVLSRKLDESIIIGDDVVVTIVDIRGEQVKIGITAPKHVSIHRKEVYEAIQEENRAAAVPQTHDLQQLSKILPSLPVIKTTAQTPFGSKTAPAQQTRR